MQPGDDISFGRLYRQKRGLAVDFYIAVQRGHDRQEGSSFPHHLNVTCKTIYEDIVPILPASLQPTNVSARHAVKLAWTARLHNAGPRRAEGRLEAYQVRIQGQHLQGNGLSNIDSLACSHPALCDLEKGGSFFPCPSLTLWRREQEALDTPNSLGLTQQI